MILYPDFAANAERRYRLGYALLIAGLLGRPLTPEQKDAAARASHTQQRRLNEAMMAQSHSPYVPWSPDDAVSTR